jgi:single-stranded-DNA-specific exonuclease
MRTTTRPGLQAIFKESNIDTLSLDAYHLGFIVGPRINAMGRLDHALDSLRLLCTRNPDQAAALANLLGDTNKERQLQTDTALSHALSQLSSDGIIVVADASYHPGIIGLIAGKLTEKYYRPAVAISVGKEQSKASARSIPGFHITDELRKHSHLFVNIGGHAQAAGFTIDTSKIGELIEVIKTMIIPTNLLIRPSRIDCQIPISSANQELYLAIQDFAPFGLGNPTPVFESLNVSISSPKRIGSSQQHLKFKAGGLDAIYFNAPSDLALTSQASLIYSLTQNTFNGSTTLQLNIKSANL